MNWHVFYFYFLLTALFSLVTAFILDILSSDRSCTIGFLGAYFLALASIAYTKARLNELKKEA